MSNIFQDIKDSRERGNHTDFVLKLFGLSMEPIKINMKYIFGSMICGAGVIPFLTVDDNMEVVYDEI